MTQKESSTRIEEIDREIAKLVKSSESAVAKQLSRGRKMLKEQLGDDENETGR